ncbi:uncharacterized protein [Miscanthus floridulus]
MKLIGVLTAESAADLCVIVLLLVLLALAVTAAEGSQDDHVEMPPPPGGSMVRVIDNNCRNRIFVAFIDDTIKYLETLIRRGREAAKRRREEAKEME